MFTKTHIGSGFFFYDYTIYYLFETIYSIDFFLFFFFSSFFVWQLVY